MITKNVQAAFPQPLMSWRRNKSANTTNSSQMNTTQAKNTTIVHNA